MGIMMDLMVNLQPNGEIFDQHGLSAAHKTLPLNSWVKVTNLDRITRPSVKMKINDRGPYIKVESWIVHQVQQRS